MDTNPSTSPVSDQGDSQPASSSTPNATLLGPSATSPAPTFAELYRDPARRESAWSPFVQIFVGPEGLYAGARWLIYIAMAFVAILVFGAVMHFIHPQRGGPVWWQMVTELGMMLAALIPGFVMAHVEGKPFGEFGLPARGAFGRNFWVGAIWGIASLTILMLALRALGVFSFGTLDLHGARIMQFGLYYALFFLITGIFEEFLLRGYSQWVLTKGMNFWPAAALLSVTFGALHSANLGETKVGLLAVVVIGFFFCLALRRTGNLWWAVGFHMSWDWGESYLYSVPDSGAILHGHLLNSSFQGPDWLTGGSVGPEGSCLLFVLIAVLWILFCRVYPQVKWPNPQTGPSDSRAFL